ncbi:M16 family metallopeptidase [Sinomicrobium sp. M5D2P9]
MKRTGLIYAIFLLSCPLLVVSQNWENIGLLDTLPFPPGLTYGKLDNGVTYYIYQDSNLKEEKVKMNLAVKAGVFTDSEQELEFSHLIEHIPFVETPTYPNGLRNFVGKFNMIRSDISGATSIETLYRFNFPKGDQKAFNAGLRWFRDIMGNLEFTDHITEQVKSEVRGELLNGGQPSSGSSLVLNGDVYRGYITSMTQLDHKLKGYKGQDIETYYKKWYIPENMGIFIVGNMDMRVNEVIKDLKKTFSDLKPSKENSPGFWDHEIAYQTRENNFLKVDGQEILRSPELRLYFRHEPYRHLISKTDFQNYLTRDVVFALVKDRLLENIMRYNAPVSSIIPNNHRYPPSFSIHHKMWSTDDIKLGLQNSIMTLRQIEKDGFTSIEFNKAIEKVKQQLVRIQRQDAQGIMENCNDNFLWNKAFLFDKPGMLPHLLTQIDQGQVMKKFAELFNRKTAMDIVLVTSDNISRNIKKEEVYEWVKAAWDMPLEISEATGHKNIKEISDRGEILLYKADYKKRLIPDLGLTEVTLINGVKVVLKSLGPQETNEDKILIKGFKPGGALLYEGADYFSALLAADIVRHSGVNEYNKFDLIEYVQNRNIQVFPNVSHDAISIKAEGKSENFRDMMELIYQYLTKPNKNVLAFEDWKRHEKQRLKNSIKPAKYMAKDSLDVILENRLNYPTPTDKDINDITLEKAYEFYKEQFTDLSGFTFVVTGNFDMDKVIPLINGYLRTLPASAQSPKLGKKETSFAAIPKGPKSYKVRDNNSLGAHLRLVFAGEFTYSIKEDIGMMILHRILQVKMHERLRYKEFQSNVYAPALGYELYNDLNAFKMSVEFKCNEKMVNTLIEAAKEVIEILKGEGLSEGDMDAAKRSLSSFFERNNNYSVNRHLVNMYKSPDSKRLPPAIEMLEQISRQDIKDLINAYLTDKHYFEFVVFGKDMDKSIGR